MKSVDDSSPRSPERIRAVHAAQGAGRAGVLAALVCGVACVISAKAPLAAGPAGPAPCPHEEELLRGLAGDRATWTSVCTALDASRVVMAAVRSGKGGPRLSVAVAAGGKILRTDVAFAGADKDATGKIDADLWQIRAAAESGASSDGLVRVSAFAESGEDYYVGQEIVAFLRLTGDGLTTLWTGLGSRLDRRFDSCVIETSATFRFLPGGKLERTTTSKRSFHDAGIDDEQAAALRKECRAGPRQRDVFDVPGAGAHPQAGGSRGTRPR